VKKEEAGRNGEAVEEKFPERDLFSLR